MTPRSRMNRLLPLLLLPVLTGCAGTLRTFPAADERILVMGRHRVDGGAVDFGASGVTFFARFDGTRLEVDLEDEFRDGTNHNWFTVVVDGGEPSRFRTEPGRRRYTLADGLAPGPHTLALSKATEGQNGRNRLVAVHAARLLAPEALPARRIEFIGNSITAGYGLDDRQVACDVGTWFDKTHAWLAYGPRVARRVGAQWMLTAVSGIGMVRNWNSPGPVMPDVYEDVYVEYTDAVTPWDFSRYTPDLVVVALGTNDFSDGDGPQPRPDLDGEAFVRAYTGFVGTVREKYPAARILLLNSPMLDPARRARLDDYLRQVVDARAAAGDTSVTRFALGGPYTSGCDAHPGLEEHVEMADALEAEVRALMGW